MVRLVYILTFMASLSQIAFSQGQLELYRGNQAFTDGELDEAKSHYEKSLSQNPGSFEGTYNLGSSNYRNESFEDAISQYQEAASQTEDDGLRAKALHNLGNAYLQGQKLDESIKAYKQALRLNPSDNETRYNLAYALKLKKEQEQQEQDQDQDQEKEDQQDQQDKEDQEKQEEQQEKEDEKKEEQEQNKDGEGEENEGEKEEQEQKGEPKPLELTPREAEQMLDAARNEDQKIQMKLKKQQKAKNKNIDKDWWKGFTSYVFSLHHSFWWHRISLLNWAAVQSSLANDSNSAIALMQKEPTSDHRI